MELIEDLDDTPTPAAGTPSQERRQPGEITSDRSMEITVSQTGEVTSTSKEEVENDVVDM